MAANYEKYAAIRDSKGMIDADVVRLTGIKASTFSEWKRGKANPKQDKTSLIALALKVSPYDFDDSPEAEEIKRKEMLAAHWDFSDEELQLIRDSRYLNEEGFEKLRDYVADLLKIDKYMN